MFLAKLTNQYPWFRRKNGELYSPLDDENNAKKKQSCNKKEPNATILELTSFSDANTYGSTDHNSPVKTNNIEEEKLTAWQASWNLTNMIQGNNVLNSPFSLLVGGIPGIILTAMVGYISCHTSKLLIECLYDVDEDGRKTKMRHTVYDIAVANLGKKFGGILIDIMQVLLMLSNCAHQLLFCGHMITALAPTNPFGFNGILLIFTISLIPFAFVKSILLVSRFSCASVVVTSVLYIVIVSYFSSRIEHWNISEFPVTTNLIGISVSFGMIIYGFDSQLYVTTLDGKMKDDANIHHMIAWTHVIGVIVKIFFGLVGVLTYGLLTKETITNNVMNTPLRFFLNIVFPLKCFLIFQFPYFAIVNLFEEKFFHGNEKSYFPSCLNEHSRLKWWAVLLRISLILFVLLTCVLIPDIALVTGYAGTVVGSFILFMLPVYFHLNMFWQRMKWYNIVHDFIVLITGVFALFCGIYIILYKEILKL